MHSPQEAVLIGEPHELLGWQRPPGAPTVRSWSGEVLARAPMWVLVEPHIGSVVPDTAKSLGGQLVQRYVKDATIFPGGEVLLLLAGPVETRVIMADPDLRWLMDVADPDGSRHETIPPMEAGWGRPWVEGGRITRSGEEAVVAGRPVEGPTYRRPMDLELNYLSPLGRFTRPPMRVTGFRGALLGAFSDGSLLVTAAAGLNELLPVADTVASMPFAVARPQRGSDGGGDTFNLQALFAAGVLVGRGDRGMGVAPVPGSHAVWTMATTSGDTVWVVPSERPELVALDRSGDVLLLVEWEAGDRSIAPGIEHWRGLARHPTASAVIAGPDGRVFVQRFGVRDGRPVHGPEWLVFSPAGDLIARLDIPTGLRVLAFGPRTALVVATADGGHQEIRLHTLGSAER